MATNPIDGTTHELILYDVPQIGENEIDQAFIDEDNLGKIENGIRKVQGMGDFLTILQGVAILKIEREGLWRQGGYDSLKAYRAVQGERLGMSPATISDRRKIGDAWLTHKKLLGRIKLEGHASKLVFLENALSLHGDPKLVLEHLRTDSYRAFKEFSTPKKKKSKKALPSGEIRVRGDTVTMGGSPIVVFPEEVSEETRERVVELLRDAGKAWAGNCLAHVSPVYDEGEARRLDNALKDIRIKNRPR